MLGAVANDKRGCLYIRCQQQNSCVGCGDHNEQDPLIAILVRPALVTLRFTVAEEYILVRAALRSSHWDLLLLDTSPYVQPWFSH
jgi:hypothetical protein